MTQTALPRQADASPPGDPAASAVRLKFADGIRGLAALWVVLFHASEGHHVDRLKAVLPPAVNHLLFDWGDLGVPAFFVLSGFVMVFMAEHVRFDRRGAFGFLARRMVRLGPPFYASIVVVLLLLMLKQRMTGTPMPPITGALLLGHLTYTQSFFEMPLLNTVYWTLSVEVQFYVAFALIMAAADRWGSRAARPWFLAGSALVGLPWVLGLATDGLYPGSFLPFWFSFAAGALACACWRHGGAMRPVFWAYVALVALAGWWQGSGFMAVSALTAGALALAGQLKRMDVWLRWRWCQFLGLTSYSLYLVHNPLSGAGFNGLKRLLPATALGEAVALAIVLAVCLAAAYALYLTVEKASIGWSRKFGRRPPAAQPPRSAQRA